jgi:HAD superfamily hydrolase (TIGR01484 family)
MRYKAIIFDIDGTAIPNSQYAKPSTRLIAAVEKAKKKAHIAAATGRPLGTASWVIDPLQLTSPSIISAGAQIYDPLEKKFIWEKLIPETTVRSIYEITNKTEFEIAAASQWTRGVPATDAKYIPQDEAVIHIMDVPMAENDSFLNALRKLPNIVVHAANGYKSGTGTLNITHKDATKKHALEILTELLGIDKSEIIGVGDGDNDLPLFDSVGFKVAVGNASDKLKAAADYIAPTAEEDGLAHVIEKYILEHQ